MADRIDPTEPAATDPQPLDPVTFGAPAPDPSGGFAADDTALAPAAPVAARLPPGRAKRQRRRRLRRIVVTALIVVVVAGLGVGVTWASVRPSSPTYRTAVAANGTVSQTVSAAGTLADVTAAHAAFSAAGTVASIDVAIGDAVKAGQVLGNLDTTALASALQIAKTNLTDAKQTLVDDTNAQAEAAASSSSSASATTSTAQRTAGSGGKVAPTSEAPTSAPSRTSATRSSVTTSATPSTTVSTTTSTGPTSRGAPGSQSDITDAQNAIIGCQQLVDYLLGKGVTQGTCSAAPATTGGTSGSSQYSMDFTPGGARSPGAGSGGGAGGAGGSGGSGVPISQGCSVILSATATPTSSASSGTETTSPGADTSDTSDTSTDTSSDTSSGTSSSGSTSSSAGTSDASDTSSSTSGETSTGDTTASTVTVTSTVTSTVLATTTITVTPTTSMSSGAPGAMANAVTQCQNAIESSVGALNNLYSWLMRLDTLLQENADAASSSASAPATTTGASMPSRGGAAPTGGSPTGVVGAGAQAGSGAGASASRSAEGQSGSQFGSGTRSGTASTVVVPATGAAAGSDGGSSSGQFAGGQDGSGQGAADAQGGSVQGTASGQGSRVPTAADIASDQSQIDLMEAKLAVATQNSAGASLISPIDGTVAQIDLAAGDQVSAGSTSQTITIVGRHQYQVTVSVPISQIGLVKTGQNVSVTVNGVDAPLTGHVTMIGVLNDSSTSTPSYPVTILLDPVSQTLFDGAGASLTIDIGAADGVLTVPTSAVTTTGSRHTVTVLSGGATSVVEVGVGLVGPELTQITSGLKAGQVVVLADVDEPLATSSSASSNGGVLGGGGGFGGGAGRVRFGG